MVARFDAHGQPGDLGKIMGDDVLGMGEIVAQRFKVLAHPLRHSF